MASDESRRRSGRCRGVSSLLLTLSTLAQTTVTHTASAWGSSSNGDVEEYWSPSGRRDYLYNSKKVNIEYVGCAWSYSSVTGDGADEDAACLANDSDDGLYYWFMMSNCKRAQVVYNVYAGSSCSDSTFQESVVTLDGLAGFASLMGNYDQYSPISENDVGDLPVCDQDEDGYYLAVGCGSDGGFTVERFTDQYCLSHYDTYYELDDINKALKQLRTCHNCYDSSTGDNAYNSLCANLIPYGDTCTSVDSPICQNWNGFTATGSKKTAKTNNMTASWANKFKYVLGSMLLAASVMMFLGILFTNRRRRRAMMHRKFRQSASRNRKSSRSKSRSGHRSRSRSGRTGSSRKVDGASSSHRDSKSRQRSKSRNKDKASASASAKEGSGTGTSGVLT